MSPRFTGSPASARASKAARGSSRKSDTRCELALRRALTKLGLRYRVDVTKLPGRPDIVFHGPGVVVFCDGDFWHGRNLDERIAKLEKGHNAPYWVEKIKTNVARDRRNEASLENDGWIVLRYWEGDIARNAEAIAEQVFGIVSARKAEKNKSV